MSCFSKLTNCYSAFFQRNGQLAVSPYIIAFKGSLKGAFDKVGNHTDTHGFAEVGHSIGICIALTIIPVLLTLTIATFALALALALLAAASMFVTYPIAMIADGISSSFCPS